MSSNDFLADIGAVTNSKCNTNKLPYFSVPIKSVKFSVFGLQTNSQAWRANSYCLNLSKILNRSLSLLGVFSTSLFTDFPSLFAEAASKTTRTLVVSPFLCTTGNQHIP